MLCEEFQMAIEAAKIVSGWSDVKGDLTQIIVASTAERREAAAREYAEALVSERLVTNDKIFSLPAYYNSDIACGIRGYIGTGYIGTEDQPSIRDIFAQACNSVLIVDVDKNDDYVNSRLRDRILSAYYDPDGPVVILTGREESMQKFLDESRPEFRSRMPRAHVHTGTEADEMRYLYYSREQAAQNYKGEHDPAQRAALVGIIPNGEGGTEEIVFTENSSKPHDANRKHGGILVRTINASDLKGVRPAYAEDVRKMNAKLIPPLTEEQRKLADPHRMVYLYYPKYKVTKNGRIPRSALVGAVPNGHGGRKEIVYTEATVLSPLDETLPYNANQILVWSGKQSDLAFLRQANERDFYNANAGLPAASKPEPRACNHHCPQHP
jgi:hypothetical protein